MFRMSRERGEAGLLGRLQRDSGCPADSGPVREVTAPFLGQTAAADDGELALGRCGASRAIDGPRTMRWGTRAAGED